MNKVLNSLVMMILRGIKVIGPNIKYFRELSFKQVSAVTGIVIAPLALTFFGSAIIKIIKENGDVINTVVNLLAQLAGIVSFTFFLVILNWKTKLIWWISSLTTILVIIMLTYQMFNPKFYSCFLRTIRFGGGFKVTIVRNVNKKMDIHDGYLLLRTRDSFFLYKPNTNHIVEIGKKNVKSIRYYELEKGLRLPQRAF